MDEQSVKIEELTSQLNSYKEKYEDLFSRISEVENFQIREPLDPFTKRIISRAISDDGTYITATSTSTLTNKRITKRVGTTASSSSLTIDSDSYDGYTITALAAAMTINAPTGTPTALQPLLIRIKDNGTARALTWNSIFRVVGVTLPTTTVISKYNIIGCVYNTVDSKWDVIMSLQEV